MTVKVEMTLSVFSEPEHINLRCCQLKNLNKNEYQTENNKLIKVQVSALI